MACKVSICPNPLKARGYCGKHYQQLRRKGGVDFLNNQNAIRKYRPDTSRVCCLDFCHGTAKTYGLCNKHYLKLFRFRKEQGLFCSKCQNDRVVFSLGLCKRHCNQMKGVCKPELMLTENERILLYKTYENEKKKNREFIIKSHFS